MSPAAIEMGRNSRSGGVRIDQEQILRSRLHSSSSRPLLGVPTELSHTGLTRLGSLRAGLARVQPPRNCAR